MRELFVYLRDRIAHAITRDRDASDVHRAATVLLLVLLALPFAVVSHFAFDVPWSSWLWFLAAFVALGLAGSFAWERIRSSHRSGGQTDAERVRAAERSIRADMLRSHLANERWDDAERVYEEQIEEAPDDPAPYAGLGRVRERRGDLPAARTCYQRALQKAEWAGDSAFLVRQLRDALERVDVALTAPAGRGPTSAADDDVAIDLAPPPDPPPGHTLRDEDVFEPIAPPDPADDLFVELGAEEDER